MGSIQADNLPHELMSHGYSFDDYSDEATPAAWLRFADLPGTATSPNPVDKWLTCPGSVPGQACGFPTSGSGYAKLPTVTFVHGDQYQSMHDGNIPEGDTWVRNTFGGYADWARTHNSLLVVTFDEDDFTPANHLPTVFYGANVKPGSYGETINHYNVLRTVEDMYGLPYLGNDATAAPITDTWGSTTLGTGSGPGPVTGYAGYCLDDQNGSTADFNPVDLAPAPAPPTRAGPCPATGPSRPSASAWTCCTAAPPTARSSSSTTATAAAPSSGSRRPTAACRTRSPASASTTPGTVSAAPS